MTVLLHHHFSFLVLILIMCYVMFFLYQSLCYQAHYLSAVCSCCSLDGIEVRLINVLASKMNFTAVFAWPSDDFNWGFVWVNGTLTGLIGRP